MQILIRILWPWIWRTAAGLLLCAALLYVGDYVIYRWRGSPRSAVRVTSLLAIPLKGNKIEFDSQGTLNLPCSVALFGQDGLDACWKLRRHPVQQTDL